MNQIRPLYTLTHRWLQECQGLFAPETIDLYGRLMEDHIIPGLGDRVEFTEEEVTGFLDGKLAVGMAETTVAMMERVLRRVLEYGHSLGQCEMPAWSWNLGTPKAKNGPVILSPLEEKQLAAYLVERPTNMHLCLFLVLTCGLSAGEVIGLQWKDVSLRNNYVRVHISRGPLKNRKNRTRKVAIGERQRIYLRKMMVSDPEAYLSSGTQKPRQRPALEMQFRKIVDELLLPPWTSPMSLRHTYAVRCIEEGMDYEMLSKKLGVDNGGVFRRFYRELVSEEEKERLDRERFENRKIRQAPEHIDHPGPDMDVEVTEIRRKVEEKKAELKNELDNLEFDLDIIRTLRNSDCVQGKAREGLYQFVEKVLGPDDKDGQYLVEYMCHNMRVATMPLRVNNVTTVQAIRSRVSHGFAKLCKRLEDINAVEGWDMLGTYKELCRKIVEMAPAGPKKTGPKGKSSVQKDYKAAVEALERLRAENEELKARCAQIGLSKQ